MNVAAQALELRERCFTVLRAVYDATRVAELRETILGLHRELGAPSPASGGLRWLRDDVELSSTGLVIHKLLALAPTLHDGLLPAPIVEVVRAVLGEDMHLELVAAVVSDHTRPFFEWHMHVGGIDDEAFRRRGLRPRYDRHRRLAVLVYLEDMTEETGQLLVYPRKVDDPVEPPFPVTQRHWPGEHALCLPAGSAVLMEQSTWHAVLPRAVATPRPLVGFWFAAADTTAERVDESLYALESLDPVLATVLPRRAHV